MDNAKVFEVLSKDLATLQASLNKYEELLFTKTEKPGTVKELVDYYRNQAQAVRTALLRLCATDPVVATDEIVCDCPKPVEPKKQQEVQEPQPPVFMPELTLDAPHAPEVPMAPEPEAVAPF